MRTLLTAAVAFSFIGATAIGATSAVQAIADEVVE